MKTQLPMAAPRRDIAPRKPDDYDNEVEGRDWPDDDESCGLVIKQAKLRAYHRLLRLLKKKSAMRLELLQELEAGAQVQPGKFQAQRKVLESQRLTWESVREYFGDSLVEELRSVIPATAQTQLIVRPKKAVH